MRQLNRNRSKHEARTFTLDQETARDVYPAEEKIILSRRSRRRFAVPRLCVTFISPSPPFLRVSLRITIFRLLFFPSCCIGVRASVRKSCGPLRFEASSLAHVALCIICIYSTELQSFACKPLSPPRPPPPALPPADYRREYAWCTLCLFSSTPPRFTQLIDLTVLPPPFTVIVVVLLRSPPFPSTAHTYIYREIYIYFSIHIAKSEYVDTDFGGGASCVVRNRVGRARTYLASINSIRPGRYFRHKLEILGGSSLLPLVKLPPSPSCLPS